MKLVILQVIASPWFYRATSGKTDLWKILCFGPVLSLVFTAGLWEFSRHVVHGYWPHWWWFLLMFMPLSLPCLAIALWRCARNTRYLALTLFARIATAAIAGFVGWWMITVVPDFGNAYVDWKIFEQELSEQHG